MNSNPTANEVQLTERMYMRIITELACNRFEWKGLPPDIDPRFLERTLFRGALSVFFEASSKLYGKDRFFALQGSPNGRQDPYDNPLSFHVYGNSFLNMTIKANKCVPIWANYLREPDWDIVCLYASKLAQIDRTISIASLNMRNTNVVFVDEDTQLSVQNLLKARDNGDMNVLVKKNGAIEPGDIVAIDMKVHPDTLPKLQIAKNKMWNECMTLMGINNANQDKAERLVADEVAANDQQVEATRRIALNARQQAVEKINRKYGLDVSVDFHVQAVSQEGEVDGNGGNNDVLARGSDT